MSLKGIGSEYRQKLTQVISVTKGMITPGLVSGILQVSQQEAGRLLSRWNHQSWVKKIKQGVYIPVSSDDMTGEDSVEDSWILASHLFAPGYIAGFSAVKYWDFSEQLFETTTFFTTKKVTASSQVIGNSRLQLKTIKEYKLFATKAVWRDNVKILVSDPTKTIVDLLDNPALVGGMRIVQDILLEYKDSEYFDIEKLIRYAEQMHNRTILKRFGYLMEAINCSDLIAKYDLSKKLSSGYALFDPSIENTVLVSRWKLKVPASWKLKK